MMEIEGKMWRTRDELLTNTINYGATDQTTAHINSNTCELTLEALPTVNNYKYDQMRTYGKRRPSLAELHDNNYNVHNNKRTMKNNAIDSNNFHSEPVSESVGFKLGWIQGVLIPCLLNIWGVMLFLRMPWVVAQAGIFEAFVIVVGSTFVCMLTTLSLSALCTNGEVKGGGIYFIISRSLGPEFGASVGLVLVFANAVSASLNTIGFCDSFNDLLKTYYNHRIFEDNVNSVRLIGFLAILIMIFICTTGIEWESKAQNFLIAAIIIGMIDFFVGTIIGPNGDNEKIAKGFVGISWDTFSDNWSAEYKYTEGVNYSFFSVFAIFFPSVTGIQAGANISGDLKDPSSSIPKGTLLSLLISMLSYGGTVIFAGSAGLRKPPANFTHIMDKEHYGLFNYQIMQVMSVYKLLIYVGCFAATLSTALTNLLTVPRLLQALGNDRIYPGLIYFSKEYGKSREPIRGYVLTFFLSTVFLLIGKLNAIAPIISNFYLASYALINFCAFHAALIQPLGWRPTFKYYNKWLSLFSCLLCLVIMFLIDWVTSFITFLVFFALYLLVMYRQPNVNWGSSTQAQIYKSALASSHRLTNVNEHVKNYQPQILLLIGEPDSRPNLLDLANLITKNNALLLCANIVKEKLSYKERNKLLYRVTNLLKDRKVKAFSCTVDGLNFEDAAKGLIQCSGIGKLRPNILMMGYKNNWTTSSTDQLTAYFNVLHTAFDNCLGVAILRMPSGLDFSDMNNAIYYEGVDNLAFSTSSLQSCKENQSSIYVISDGNGISNMPMESPSPSRKLYNWENVNNKQSKKTDKRKTCSNKIFEIYSSNPNISDGKVPMWFSSKQKGTIDVWWLYDDGGLTILLPYILSTRSIFEQSKLRIFALTNSQHNLAIEEKNMANLLQKFRIKYSSLKMISDVVRPKSKQTEILFENMIRKFKTDFSSDCFVSENELNMLKPKTDRQLRLRELLVEYSKDATLLIMSLPMPRKGVVPAAIYMAWLEVLTRDMPPFLLVRGNQRSVLTFYS